MSMKLLFKYKDTCKMINKENYKNANHKEAGSGYINI